MEQRIPNSVEPSIRENFEKAKLAGFDGMCLDLAMHEMEDFRDSKSLFKEYNLDCMINAFPYHSDEMQYFIDMAKDFNASCLNVISGVMPLKPSDAIPIVKNWIKEAEKADVKILFETHRDSLLNDLFFTIQLMDLIPEMRLCADLSHIVVDRELRLPLNDRDNEYINKVINRSDCFQGRVANREQIQIQIDFPQHAEWVEQFKSWWKIGLNDWHMRNDDDAELIFLCELGPRPYAITDGNQEELSDRWNEALIIRKWIQSFWNEIQK